MKSKKTIILWILSAFMFVSALVFMPSAASILMIIFAVVAAPIKPIQNFLSGIGLTPPIHIALLVVLFFVSMLIAPTNKNDTENQGATQLAVESLSPSISQEIATSTPAPTPTPTPTPTSTPTPSLSVPSAEPSSVQTEAPAVATITPEEEIPEANTDSMPSEMPTAEQPVVNVEEENNPQYTYVGSIDSDKYHKPSCRWAKKILPENEIWFYDATDAESQGYSPCGTCLS